MDIYVLVGVPAAGKSTWVANKFQGECHVVSSDDVIERFARDEGKTYNDVFNKYIKDANRIAIETFDRYVRGHYTPIIIDRTNMSIKSRSVFLDRLKSIHNNHPYDVHAVVFRCPPNEEHQRRLASRPGKTIPAPIIESMKRSFNMPSTAEGFASITVV